MSAAIVLAGGASRRMGRDKAWLELDGRPLLAHVVELLARRCAPIVIAARPGQALPKLAVAAIRIDDPVPDAGPLVGLHAALERLAALGVERAYLSSCDAAALSEVHVAFMLERLRRAGAGALAAVAVEADGRRHPLASALAVAPLRERAADALAAGDQRLQALFRGPGIIEVEVEELPAPEVLAPCNTPAQWAALVKASRMPRGSGS